MAIKLFIETKDRPVEFNVNCPLMFVNLTESEFVLSWRRLPNINVTTDAKAMNKMKSVIALSALVLTALPMMGQQHRLSPHETTSTVIDGNRVTVTYGRPYTKSPRTGEVRKIWGGLVPYGKVWRTGADEATILITQKPITFGDTTVPAGAYTLWTLPQADGTGTLIINKQIGQWGEGKTVYDEHDDVGRVTLQKQTLDTPVNQFTITIAKNEGGGGVLKLSWENTQFSAPFTVQK